jgi:hypothetical protein
MKPLLFVVLMTVCTASLAEWEYAGAVEKRDGKVVYYFDKSTIRINGAIVRMWTMSDYSTVQTNSSGERYTSDKTLWVFHCSEEISAVISFVQYADSMGKGVSLFSATVKESSWDWQPIIPNSLGKTIWEIACTRR